MLANDYGTTRRLLTEHKTTAVDNVFVKPESLLLIVTMKLPPLLRKFEMLNFSMAIELLLLLVKSDFLLLLITKLLTRQSLPIDNVPRNCQHWQTD